MSFEEYSEETNTLCDEALELLNCLNVKNVADLSDDDELTTELQTKLHDANISLNQQENRSVRLCVLTIVQIGNLLDVSERCLQSLQIIKDKLDTSRDKLYDAAGSLSNLQKQSLTLKIESQNRQSSVDKISTYINEMTLSERMVHILTDKEYSPVDIKYVEQVHELMFQREHLQSIRQTESCMAFQKTDDIISEITKQVMDNIYVFFLEKIACLRRPMSAVDEVHNDMLKIKYLYDCLRKENPTLAKKITDEYLDTTGKTTYTYVCMLYSKLNKLRQPERQWNDSVQKSNLSIFCMANRDDILTVPYADRVVIPHTVGGSTKFPIEVIFRSLQLPLLDVCCREYLFTVDMFNCDKQAFFTIFDRTFCYCHEQLKSWVITSNDIIGQLLCIHIIFQLQVTAHDREVPVIQSYHQSLCRILENRILEIIEKHGNLLDNLCDDNNVLLTSRHYSELIAAAALLDEKLSISDSITLSINELATKYTNYIRNVISCNHTMLKKCVQGQHTACGIIEARLNACENHPIILINQSLLVHLLDLSTVQAIQQTPLKCFIENNIEGDENNIEAVMKVMQKDLWKFELDLLVQHCISMFNDFNLTQRLIHQCLKLISEAYCSVLRNMQKDNILSIGIPSVNQFMNELKKYKNGL